MWKQIGTGAALLVAITAAGGVMVARPAPERPSVINVSISRLASGQSFTPVCKANEITDSRPDPAWVGVSFAGDNCRAPPIPASVNGVRASRAQIVASMAAMKSYTAASDAFQRCIRDFISAKRVQADKNKEPVNMSLVIIETHRIIASENNKNKVAGQVRVAINAFNEYGSECPAQ